MEHLPPTRAELELVPGVILSAGVDVDELAVRFEVWQALTHGFQIDNPMDSSTLDEVIVALAPQPGMRAIDIPCGRGELLLRLADRGVLGTGVDLSPWVIRDAAVRASTRGQPLALHLGDGKAFPRSPNWEIACSLGGSWIWNGTAGTLQALAALTTVGGRIALGDIVLKEGADPTELDGVGVPLTRSQLAEQAKSVGLTPSAWFTDNAAAWERYVEAWPGHIARFTHDPAKWAAYGAFAEQGRDEFAREQELFEWVVMVAEATA